MFYEEPRKFSEVETNLSFVDKKTQQGTSSTETEKKLW